MLTPPSLITNTTERSDTATTMSEETSSDSDLTSEQLPNDDDSHSLSSASEHGLKIEIVSVFQLR